MLIAGVIIAAFAVGVCASRPAGARDPAARLAIRGLFAGGAGLVAAYVFDSGRHDKHLGVMLALLLACATARADRVARRLGGM